MKNTVQSIKSIVENSSQTADDLRGFLTQLRGKSAGEMLGVLAQSGLVRATIQATVATLVLMFAFTAGPYWIYGGPAKTKSGGKGAPAAAGAQAGAAARANATGNNGAADKGASADAGGAAGANAAGGTANAGAAGGNAANAGAGGKSGSGASGKGAGGADLERAAKVLGLDETKLADPKSNPREKDLDSLLDKVK